MAIEQRRRRPDGAAAPPGAGAPAGPPPARAGGSVKRVVGWLRRGGGRKLFRYSIASVVATAVSQLTLLMLYGVFAVLAARNAAVAATLAGAVPSYFLNRNWAWSRSGRSRVMREVLPYLASTIAGLVFSTWASDMAATHAAGMSHAWRTAVVSGAYLGSFALLWVAKFVLFDRLLFVPRAEQVEPAR